MTIAVQEAIVTLYNPPMERAISSPPVKPKGGQGFLYVAESSANEGVMAVAKTVLVVMAVAKIVLVPFL